MGPVVGGNAAPLGKHGKHDLLGGTDAQHGAAREFLHHAAAFGDQPDGILQAEGAGQRSGRELPDAVTDERGGPQAPVQPLLGQRILDGEERRLGVARALQGLGGFLFSTGRREYQAFQVAAKGFGEQVAASVEVLAEDRFLLVQVAAHVHVLGSLAGEHEHHPVRRLDQLRSGGPHGILRGDRGSGLPRIARHHDAAVLEVPAAGPQRVGHIGQRDIGMSFQPAAQLLGVSVQRSAALRAQHEQLLWPRGT